MNLSTMTVMKICRFLERKRGGKAAAVNKRVRKRKEKRKRRRGEGQYFVL